MSHEVEVIRRQFDALASDGVDAAAEYWHPDIDWRAVEGAADDHGVMKGTQALRRYYEDWNDSFEDLRAEVDEVLAESAGRCAVAVRNSGRARGSSAVVRGRYYVVCSVRDGQIVSGREYQSRDDALQAFGRR